MPTPKPKTITYKTLTWQLDPELLNDLDIMEALYNLNHAEEAQDNEDGALAIVPLMMKLCGDKYAQVKKILRDSETGRITADKIGEFVQSVLEQLNPNS